MPISQDYQPDEYGVLSLPQTRAFAYSDGDAAEEELFNIVQESKDRSVFSLELGAKRTWPAIYHLSPTRANLLRPLRYLLENASVLELGSGCGGISRYLGETATSLVCVEGSIRRARTGALRCADLPNVTVVSDTIQHFASLHPDNKYDVVTLIGVLEYSRMFDKNSASPELELLRLAKNFLKPDGCLLLAIENKLGLKYFAGSREDHTGQAYVGINNAYRDFGPVTFGRRELEKVLTQSGFSHLTQLIPLPDYKLPTGVLMPACFDGQTPNIDPCPLLAASDLYDWQSTSLVGFSVPAAYRGLVENGLIQDLCNSFLYIAACSEKHQPSSRQLAFHYGPQRLPRFSRETAFERSEDKVLVFRRSLCPQDQAGPSDLQNHAPDVEPYLPYPSPFEQLTRVMNRPGWTEQDVAAVVVPYVKFLQASARKDEQGKLVLPANSLDMTLANVLVDENGAFIPFDLEWSFADSEPVPLNFVALKGLYSSFDSLKTVAPPRKGIPDNVIMLAKLVLLLAGLPMNLDELTEYVVKITQIYAMASGFSIHPDHILQRKLNCRLVG
ncbi:MAG: class I SAM-dependent methyltransferase [Deltaproteobacteria bacterium]|jgi:2-polyprenyl-3-methyl-5-hydroxy-6-metoxy-1,4-benzoquinol methylase|nr:class I SAM-dependent methyltransferase [Deltaproteobacteria bacterium]